jgi:two-component system cell cycle sensor histidine kinase/response regulator CckA
MNNLAAHTPMRVLLVDDDEDQYVLTKDQLGDGPAVFDVDWAATFDDGLRRFATVGYDVALVDYRLGARDGVELLRTDTVQQAGVPSIMLTGDGDGLVDVDAMAAGAVDYLVKSEVTAPMLKRALRYAVEGHRVLTLLKQREGSLRAMLEDSADVILLVDAEGDIRFASDAVRHIEGRESSDLIGRSLFEGIHPDDVGEVRRSFHACASVVNGRAAAEYRQQHGDGTWRRREATAVNRLAQPGLAAIVVTYRDVTARTSAEAQQAHLAAIVESSDDAIFSRTLDGKILSWNTGAERLYGYTADEALGQDVATLVPPEGASALESISRTIRAGECVRQREIVCRRKDSSQFPVLLTISPMRNRDGGVVGSSSVAHDITERRRFQAALAESEAEYRSTFNEAPVGIAHISLDGHWLRSNARLLALLGYSIDEMRASDFASLTHPDDVRQSVDARTRLLAGEIARYASERRYRRVDGTYVWVNLIVSLHRDGTGAAKYFIAIVEDISERKQAQHDLDQIFNLSPDMICTSNYEGYFTRTNDAWPRVLGHTAAQLRDTPFVEFVHPDDRADTLAQLSHLTEGQTIFGFTNRYRTASGSYRWIEWHAQADLAARVIYAVARDQTDRRALQEQFQQAQKMEAVGRLAGGVAHDFNNLLTAILGYCELVIADLDDDDPHRADIVEIQGAGTRAAGLTRQLLAFSRKQMIEPTLLDLNVIIADMQRMLARLIGEDVAIVTDLRPGLAAVKADRSQVEQVIVNLAVNARDAMPDGGTLTIGSANVEIEDPVVATRLAVKPGPYVMLTVADTGTGMTPEVQARLFEPFFTTKETGKGTGLGMATVYGIVAQNGGAVAVYSQVGKGAVLEVYFPRASAAASSAALAPQVTLSRAGGQTVLVVEDADGLRHLAKRLLERMGYAVLVAASAREAVSLFETESIDVLVTDVVMPGASGPELVKHLLTRWPALRVCYMSGYTEDDIVRHGVLQPGIVFLHKPFTSETLGRKVREALDG